MVAKHNETKRAESLVDMHSKDRKRQLVSGLVFLGVVQHLLSPQLLHDEFGTLITSLKLVSGLVFLGVVQHLLSPQLLHDEFASLITSLIQTRIKLYTCTSH